MKARTYKRKPLPANQGDGYYMPDVGKPYISPVLLSCQACAHYIKPEQSRGMVSWTVVHPEKENQEVTKLVHLNGKCDR